MKIGNRKVYAIFASVLATESSGSSVQFENVFVSFAAASLQLGAPSNHKSIKVVRFAVIVGES